VIPNRKLAAVYVNKLIAIAAIVSQWQQIVDSSCIPCVADDA
jgi:hypothetical protein